MLIWFDAEIGALGVEDGVIRACDVSAVNDIEALRRRARQTESELMARAQAEARTLLDDVRQRSDVIVEQARAQAQTMHDEAARHAEAEAERGYADGHDRAVEEWHARHAGQRQAQAQTLQAMDARLAEIVTMAVRRIVHAEQPEALFTQALASVQSLTRGHGTVTMRVSATDVDKARAALGRLPPAAAQDMLVDVLVDPALGPGSCVFESEHGMLDASLETQLRGLRNAMVRAVRKALADEEDGEPAVPAESGTLDAHLDALAADEDRTDAGDGFGDDGEAGAYEGYDDEGEEDDA